MSGLSSTVQKWPPDTKPRPDDMGAGAYAIATLVNRSESATWMKPPGGVSTSALPIPRDARAMTTGLHAQVGWSPRRPVGSGLGSAPRRHAAGWPVAAQEPAGPRSPARAFSWHVTPAAAGVATGLEGQAHATIALPACEGPSAVGKGVTCGCLSCAYTCPERSSVGTFPLVSSAGNTSNWPGDPSRSVSDPGQRRRACMRPTKTRRARQAAR
jgi:hypothetical protein